MTDHKPAVADFKLAGTLSKDPALVQGLLRTANSAAYAAGRKSVLSVDGSIERIGLAGARAVVMANCVDGLLSRPGGHFDVMVNDVHAASHRIRWRYVAYTTIAIATLYAAFRAAGGVGG